MVDLMMWLVVAALLLAAAIQGIGYYQKAAYLNNMKSDANNAGTNALTVAANNKGDIDTTVVNQAVADTSWSAEDTSSVEIPSEAGRKPYIRVTHPGVTDKDVIYLFDSCGEDYAIGPNVIPKGGTPALQACGVAAAAPGGGSGGTGGGQSTSTGILTLADVASSNLQSDQEMIDYMNANLATYNAEELAANQAGWDDPSWNAWYNSPGEVALTKLAPEAPNLYTYQPMLDKAIQDYPDVAAANNKVNDASNVYYASVDSATAANQQAVIDAYRELYLLLLSKPATAMPTFNLGQYANMTVTAGSTTPYSFTITVPNANTSSVVSNIMVNPRRDWSKFDSPNSVGSYSVVNGTPTISGSFDNWEQYYPDYTDYRVAISATVDGVLTYGIINVTVTK